MPFDAPISLLPRATSLDGSELTVVVKDGVALSAPVGLIPSGASSFETLTDSDSAPIATLNTSVAVALNQRVSKTNPSMDGPVTSPGAEISPSYPVTGGVIQTGKLLGKLVLAGTAALTLDNVTPTADTWTYVRVINPTNGPLQVTFASTQPFSMGANALIAGVLVPANSRSLWEMYYDGTIWHIEGEPGARNNYAATLAPAVTDDASAGYGIGSVWFDGSNKHFWTLIDPTVGAALWKISDGAPVTVFGSAVIGQTLTAQITPGWDNTGGGNWTRDGTNISGATSMTYVTVSGDGGHTVTYKSANIKFIPPGVAVAADTVPPTISQATVTNATPTIINVTTSKPYDNAFLNAAEFTVSAGHAITAITAVDSTHFNLTTSTAFVGAEAARTLSITQTGTNDLRNLSGFLAVNASGIAIVNNVAVLGALSYTTPAQAANDLTAAGWRDWVLTGGNAGGANDVRKASANLISGVTTSAMTRFSGPGMEGSRDSYTDAAGGTAAGTATSSAAYSPTTVGTPGYIEFTVPADTTLRTMRLVVGNYFGGNAVKTGQKIRATLSDGSSTELLITNPANASNFLRLWTEYEFTYKAASAAQTLRFRIECDAGVGASFITFLYEITAG